MKTGAQHLYLSNNDEDDDILDERGIVRDGQIVRSPPMYMMDSVQLAVAMNDAQHEPETLADAYAAAEARLTNAWRDPAPVIAPEPQQPTNDGKQEPATLDDAYAAYHERLTTAYKNPPPVVPIVPDSNPQSLFPPPSSMMTDERERLYARRNEVYENAWKNPL